MAEADKNLRVFISYARRDCSAFAQELLQGLEVAGFEAFLDKHDIAAGEDWEERLGGLIQSADTVVFVVSPAAVTSERCAWEVQRAEALSKRIVPVVAFDVPEADTPQSLKRLNYIFFSQDRSFTAALAELAKALRVDLDWIREHTRLGELARRWQARDRNDALFLRGLELDAARTWLASWKAPAPEPTDLHRAFINASDAAEGALVQRERRRQRVLLWSVAAAALVFAGLAVTAGVSAVQANNSAREAERRRAGEQTAQQGEARALNQLELEAQNALRERDNAIAARNQAELERTRADSAAQAAREAEGRANAEYGRAMDRLLTIYSLAMAAAAQAGPVSRESIVRRIDWLTVAQRALYEGAVWDQEGVRLVEVNTRLGWSHLQLAGLVGAVGGADFDCAVRGMDARVLQEAERYFARVLAHDPNGPGASDAHRGLGCMLEARGEHRRAIEAYRRAVAIFPQDPENQRYLDRALAGAGGN